MKGTAILEGLQTMHPDPTRRCDPSGYVGRSPYWTKGHLDEWKATKYRGPGRPPEGREE